MKRMPFANLTGFLGTGTTRLLNRLIDQPGSGETTVIENEFGGVVVMVLWSHARTSVFLPCRSAAFVADLG